MGRLLVLALAVACGGGQKQTDDGSSGGGEKTCEPGRCLEDVAKLVQEHRNEARACYDAKPGLPDARVIINFEIDPEGKVVDVSQSVKEGQLDDKEIVACIADVIKEITFAKSAKGKKTRAYHTFEFAARGKQN